MLTINKFDYGYITSIAISTGKPAHALILFCLRREKLDLHALACAKPEDQKQEMQAIVDDVRSMGDKNDKQTHFSSYVKTPTESK